MAKPPYIELGQGPDAERIPILFEDRAVIAIDKPRHWMLVPFTWQKTDRNLQAAIQSSIGSGAFWARSRHVRFLRYVHRLDADTTGILLFAKSPGGTHSLGELFESRRMHKRYLAVVRGVPRQREWTCDLKLEKDPHRIGRMQLDAKQGKDAETTFRVLESRGDFTLVEALPLTGRTHQIRVHLAAGGFPILGDDLYGGAARVPLALRAVELKYEDPFTRRPIRITAPTDWFLKEYGFGDTRPQPSSPNSPAAGPAPAPPAETPGQPSPGTSPRNPRTGQAKVHPTHPPSPPRGHGKRPPAPHPIPNRTPNRTAGSHATPPNPDAPMASSRPNRGPDSRPRPTPPRRAGGRPPHGKRKPGRD